MPTILLKDTFIAYLETGDPTQLPRKMEDGYSLEEFIEVDGIKINDKVSILNQIHFRKGIVFKGCQFPNGLKFINCKGKGGIRFINCSSPGFNSNDPKPAIEFQNFTFDDLSFEICNFPNGINLYRTSERHEPNILSSLKINKGSFEQAGITIENVKIKYGIQLDHVINGGVIKIKDVETGDESAFRYVEANDIQFSGEGLILRGGLNINRCTLSNLTFIKGRFEGEIKISEPRIKGQLSFIGPSISGRTILTTKPEIPFPLEKTKFSTSIPSVLIHSTDFNEGFSLDGENQSSKKIEINFSPLLKGRLVFSNVNINKLLLTGTNSDNNLYFRNIGFEEIIINDFLNLKSLSFSNLNLEYTKSKNALFKILDSDLGNWELANFDFDAFKKIFWRDSQISGLRTSAVSWFEDSKLEAEGENDPSTCLRRREFYKQLKQSSEKQGDRINELEFKRRELKAYKAALKIRKEKKVDRFTIWTGGSNNHGQDWIKPLLLIIGISTVFFPILFYFADSEISAVPDLSNNGFHFFFGKVWEHLAVWPQLFNLTRRVSDLFPEPCKLSFGVYFFDGLHRIFLAFFISRSSRPSGSLSSNDTSTTVV